MQILHLIQVLLFTEVVYGKKVDIKMILGDLGPTSKEEFGLKSVNIFLIQLSIGQNLKVMMPDSYNPSFLPYWKRNSATGEITGYLVDLLQELSKSVGFNYTLEDSSNFTTYEALGKMTKTNPEKTLRLFYCSKRSCF